MTHPEPPEPRQRRSPESSAAARPRAPRGARSRRPSVQPTRKAAMAPRRIPASAEEREQDLGVELRPIGGIFGTSTSLEVSEKTRRRLLRVPKRLRFRRGSEEKEASLLDDPDFRMLWLSRLLSQTAQGALLYALLILVVDLSNRSFFNSLFVACSNIPSIAFGLPAGLVVDTISRKHLLVMLNGFRFLFMLFLVGSAPSLAGVFAATLGIWVIHQFYSPSEASMLADLVPPERYTSAQALFNLALTISQAVGLVLLAPLMLRIGGPELVFVLAGALWLIAGAMTVLLPSLPTDRAMARRP